MNNVKKHRVIIGYFIFSFILSFALLHGDASVNGKVKSALSGDSIPGVNIVLLSIPGEERIENQVTNAQGVYQFENVRSGQYKVQIEPPAHFVPVSTHFFMLTVENIDLNANFTLGIPGNITGLVIDNATALPIENANVDIMRGNNIITSVLTDANGIYNAMGLAPRPYIVRVRMPYFQSDLQFGIPVSGETIIVNFALECPPGKIIGQMVDEYTGQPLMQATVEVLLNGILIDSVQSDENGHYTLSEIVPNQYEIKASALDFYAMSQWIDLSNNQILTANFSLKSFGTVVGHVVHAFTGEPLMGASVGVWQNNELFASTSTDRNGYFSLNGLGQCQIVVQALNFHLLEQEINIEPAQTFTLDFNLACSLPKPPRKLHGKVVKTVFAHQINSVHFITWEASFDPSVISYRLYTDEKLLTEVSAVDPLVVELSWRNSKTKKYQLTAVNRFGQESDPLSIHLPLKKGK